MTEHATTSNSRLNADDLDRLAEQYEAVMSTTNSRVESAWIRAAVNAFPSLLALAREGLAARERIAQSGANISCVEGDFGKTWQLRQGDVIVDTYCPGNGDQRPDWMYEPGFEQSRGKRMTDDQLVALARTCEIHDRFYIKDWAWDREDERKAYFSTDYLAGLIEEVQEARRGAEGSEMRAVKGEGRDA